MDPIGGLQYGPQSDRCIEPHVHLKYGPITSIIFTAAHLTLDWSHAPQAWLQEAQSPIPQTDAPSPKGGPSVGVSKNQRPGHRTQIGLSFSGHHKKGPPICRSSRIRVLQGLSGAYLGFKSRCLGRWLPSTSPPSRWRWTSIAVASRTLSQCILIGWVSKLWPLFGSPKY